MKNALTSVQEACVVIGISSIFALRMLGLFMILPVFALYANGGAYGEVSGWMIGLTIGIYGLAQALLQIPFGLLSDRYGRKKMIFFGLFLFAVGSVVAALAENILTVIVGRVLQGAGAVAAVLLALVADLVPSERRTRAMASVGMSIGAAFFLSLLLGPLLYDKVSVPGIFWFTAALSLGGMVILWYIPSPYALRKDRAVTREQVFAMLKNPQLVQLDIGVFSLHAIMTALFVAIPFLFVQMGVVVEKHWQLYLVVIFASLFLMLPMIIASEKHKKKKIVYPLAIALIFVSLTAVLFYGDQLWLLVAMLVFYFGGFNTLEALLPSMVSQQAESSARGAAMGVYSSAQFFGAFFGGLVGGGLLTYFNSAGVIIGCSVLSFAWLLTVLASIYWRKNQRAET